MQHMAHQNRTKKTQFNMQRIIFWENFKDSFHNIPDDKVHILKPCSHLICHSCINMLVAILAMNTYTCSVYRAPFIEEDNETNVFF